MKNASTPLLSFFGQTKFGLRLPVLYMAIYDSPPLCTDDSSLSRSVCTSLACLIAHIPVE